MPHDTMGRGCRWRRGRTGGACGAVLNEGGGVGAERKAAGWPPTKLLGRPTPLPYRGWGARGLNEGPGPGCGPSLRAKSAINRSRIGFLVSVRKSEWRKHRPPRVELAARCRGVSLQKNPGRFWQRYGRASAGMWGRWVAAQRSRGVPARPNRNKTMPAEIINPLLKSRPVLVTST